MILQTDRQTGYPSVDKPWLKYYPKLTEMHHTKSMSAYNWILERNEGHESDIALVYYGRKITYGELFDNIEQTKKDLCRIGIERGSVVTVISVETPELLYLIYAANALGAIINMVDPRYEEEKMISCISEVHSEMVIVLDALYGKVITAVNQCSCVELVILLSVSASMGFPIKQLYCLASKRLPDMINASYRLCRYQDLRKIGRIIAQKVHDRKSFANATFMFYTGGSTGVPKAVLLGDDQINAGVQQYVWAENEFKRQESWLSISAIFFAYSWQTSVHLPLSLGMVCHIEMFNPAKIVKSIIRKKYQHVSVNPGIWEELLKQKNAKDMSFLIAPVSGGEALSNSLEDKLNQYLSDRGSNWKICQGYGMTEVGGGMCINFGGHAYKKRSAGIPFVDMTVSAFEPNTIIELHQAEIGEICITGPSVMLGYYKNMSETENALKIHDDGKLWMHSGDLGYIDEDGFLYIVGRIKRMVVGKGGWKIYPAKIEEVILKHPDVSSCAVICVNDTDEESEIKIIVFAVIASVKTEAAIEKGLKSYCRSELGKNMQPDRYYFVEYLPRTNVGKIDYLLLEKMAKSM